MQHDGQTEQEHSRAISTKARLSAAHYDFMKLLRWQLVPDNRLNTMSQSKD